jgi:hypothetical protein
MRSNPVRKIKDTMTPQIKYDGSAMKDEDFMDSYKVSSLKAVRLG